MKNTVLILLLSIATNLMAQKDTLYFKLDTIYQQNWIETIKNEAEFYRPLPLKKVGDLYQIKDYYINGNLQMEGMVTNPKNVYTYQGKITWYYKNGQKKEVENYLDNKRNGLFLTYFEDGTLKTEGTYKNDEPFTGAFYDDYYNTLSSFKEGKKHGFFIQYNKNGKLITKQEYDEGKITGLVKSESYLTNKICECEYK